MTDEAHDEFMLGAYVLELLDTAETRRASEHLVGCGSCQTEYEQLAATKRTLERLPAEWLVHGPPLGSAVLEVAMRRIRARKAAARGRSRRAFMLAASLAGLAGSFSTGLLVGAQIQPAAGPVPSTPTPSPAISASPAAGVRQASGVDPVTRVSMTATVVPATTWVRVRAAVSGIPAGENCRLLVVRHDGSREIAGGWVTSKRGETEAVVLDGSAAVLPSEVKAVLVESTAGKTYIAVSF